MYTIYTIVLSVQEGNILAHATCIQDLVGGGAWLSGYKLQRGLIDLVTWLIS